MYRFRFFCEKYDLETGFEHVSFATFLWALYRVHSKQLGEIKEFGFEKLGEDASYASLTEHKRILIHSKNPRNSIEIALKKRSFLMQIYYYLHNSDILICKKLCK